MTNSCFLSSYYYCYDFLVVTMIVIVVIVMVIIVVGISFKTKNVIWVLCFLICPARSVEVTETEFWVDQNPFYQVMSWKKYLRKGYLVFSNVTSISSGNLPTTSNVHPSTLGNIPSHLLASLPNHHNWVVAAATRNNNGDGGESFSQIITIMSLQRLQGPTMAMKVRRSVSLETHWFLVHQSQKKFGMHKKRIPKLLLIQGILLHLSVQGGSRK